MAAPEYLSIYSVYDFFCIMIAAVLFIYIGLLYNCCLACSYLFTMLHRSKCVFILLLFYRN